MTEYTLTCTECWKFEDHTPEDEETAERRAQIHYGDHGHPVWMEEA